jgi:hypothetical protein
LAEDRGHEFVDLFHGMLESPQWGVLTDNGIHLNANGYREVARIIDQTLHPDSGLSVNLADPTQREDYETVRGEIIQKNQYFFYRWRAHNGEYIYGRRAKGSGDGYGQGNSGNEQFPSEMAEFDRLIEEKEKRISDLASDR